MTRRRLRVWLLVVTAAISLAWALQAAHQRVQVARGDALFHGAAPLAGRVTGQTMQLPAAASRCMNCHEARGSAASAAASAVLGPPGGAGREGGSEGGQFGPALDHITLAEPRPRRGGPPSRYDAASLCALLRTGIDPAQVMIPQTMPRYTIDTADCDALWAYLSAR